MKTACIVERIIGLNPCFFKLKSIKRYVELLDKDANWLYDNICVCSVIETVMKARVSFLQ